MKNATDWQAGGEYTYTVSLATAKDGLYHRETTAATPVSTADGLMNIAKLVNGGKSDINITLDKDIDLTGKSLDTDRHRLRQLIQRHLRWWRPIPLRADLYDK